MIDEVRIRKEVYAKWIAYELTCNNCCPKSCSAKGKYHRTKPNVTWIWVCYVTSAWKWGYLAIISYDNQDLCLLNLASTSRLLLGKFYGVLDDKCLKKIGY